MKNSICLTIAVLAALAVLAAGIGTAGAVSTNVSVTFTADINYTDVNINGTLNATTCPTYLETFYFPTTLEQINQTGDLNLTIKAGSNPVTLTITINGVETYSGTLAADSIGYQNLTMMKNAGVSLSVNYLTINVTVTANETAWTNLTVVAEDFTPCGSNFSYTISETKLSSPEVEFYEKDSFYSVKDTVTVKQTSDFNVTNVTANFTYPSNAINKGVASHNYGTLNSSQSKSYTVYYQKRGPYVGEIKNELNTNYVTTIGVYSPENLTASMEFNPSEKPWSKYFPSFSKENIVSIELNGKDVDWEDPSGVVKIESMTLNKGWNTLNVTYSKYVAHYYYYIAVEEEPWYEQEFLGVPMWLWIIAVAFFLVCIYLGVRK